MGITDMSPSATIVCCYGLIYLLGCIALIYCGYIIYQYFKRSKNHIKELESRIEKLEKDQADKK